MSCGVCAFRTAGCVDGRAPTAAFVVVFHGASLARVTERAAARAQKRVVPGATAYCTNCRCVTWLARAPALADALIEHEREHAVGVCVQRMQQTL